MLPADCEADLLADRVVIWEPPLSLYEQTFYGQPLEGREYDEPTLQCSLLEATYLAERGALALEAETVRERGREVEGERFDRRLTVYTALRERGVVPKTGYKFGADFRTYADVESVENLGHPNCWFACIRPSMFSNPVIWRSTFGSHTASGRRWCSRWSATTPPERRR